MAKSLARGIVALLKQEPRNIIAPRVRTVRSIRSELMGSLGMIGGSARSPEFQAQESARRARETRAARQKKADAEQAAANAYAHEKERQRLEKRQRAAGIEKPVLSGFAKRVGGLYGQDSALLKANPGLKQLRRGGGGWSY